MLNKICSIVAFLLLIFNLNAAYPHVKVTLKSGNSLDLNIIEFGFLTRGEMDVWKGEFEIMNFQCESFNFPIGTLKKMVFLNSSLSKCNSLKRRVWQIIANKKNYSGWENDEYIGVRSLDRNGKEIKIKIQQIKTIEFYH